jgi:4'-phosphopantetheinyl transferase
MVEIFYTHFPQPLPDRLWQQYLEMLPLKLRERTMRYRRWQDQHAHVLGKLLLQKGLVQKGYDSTMLSEIQYTAENRPYLNNNIDFNISHTGNYVVCALSNDTTLGIDIEEVKTIDFNDFKNTMNPDQWQEINTAQDPIRKFFEYWTIKESLIKADGRGLSIPLTELIWQDGTIICDNKRWYYQSIHIAENIPCYIATSKPVMGLKVQKTDFSDFDSLDS